MTEKPHHIVRAWLETPGMGIIELDRDWTLPAPPRFSFGKHCSVPRSLGPAPGLPAGRSMGYFFNAQGGGVSFVLPLEHGCDIDPRTDVVYLAGDFNGWQEAVGVAEWRMRPAELEGEQVLLWTGDAARFLGQPGLRFKFVTGEHQWVMPPTDAPNVIRDEHGNLNRVIDPHRTGWHLWRFTLTPPLSLSESCNVTWAERAPGDAPSVVESAERDSQGAPLMFGDFFYELRTDLPLGALVSRDETVFRIFAPRARVVLLRLTQVLGSEGREYSLTRRPDSEASAGVWEVALDQNLHGWYYWYSIDGPAEDVPRGGFDPTIRILDPYALATVGREGPGIVIDRARLPRREPQFRTPAWQDLIIAEAHVRDLAAHAPTTAQPAERLGFAALRKWVESEDFYLHRLGVNCVELQPIHEFDNLTPEEYHWGYMTTAFLAPASSYALKPEQASGLRELQELVAAFHRRGIAVILDVVFNHVGTPAHLMFIDRLYYFEQDRQGVLTNWSGCGNDLRARSAMARRLIIDSCRHFMETFGVDGFRFDLAELLGLDVLRDVEAALKRTHPGVILIAEPWSFRGHIAGALRDTGWASWNDGFRVFMRDYVHGKGPAGRLEYFLRGSPWYFAKWPAQTINYTESHDDRTWIDDITENSDHNGFSPTPNDERRTRLMAALLFMSVGVPMIAAGQDFLRSKHGVNNTYQRGDLNALDYGRILLNLGSHAYFAEWIAFRRSERGRLLRQWSRPGEGFFEFAYTADSPALGVILNADGSQGAQRLLFAINPTLAEVRLQLGERLEKLPRGLKWKQLANHDRFFPEEVRFITTRVEPSLFLPPLSCGLWSAGH